MKFTNIRTNNWENALRGMRNPKESYQKSDSRFGLGKWENVVDEATHVLEIYHYDKETNSSTYSDYDLNNFLKDVIIYEDRGYFEYAAIGPEDMRLAQTLIKAGSEHRKFMRQIFVSVDITAPLFWWKEMDTYKVATTANSTSTMHTIHKKEITLDSFETDDYHPELMLIDDVPLGLRVDCFIDDLEQLRQLYLMYNEKAKEFAATDKEKSEEYQKIAKMYWKELIRWTPEAWQQTRTWTGSYENLFGMCSPGQRRHHKITQWSGCGEDFISESFIKFARNLPYARHFIFIDENNALY